MKKFPFLALLLAVPLSLTACAGVSSPLIIQPNWYKNTSRKDIGGTYEKLEYAVTFQKDSQIDIGLSMEYSNGIYTTVLANDTTEDGQEVYVLTSELDVDVTFRLNGTDETETVHDHSLSEVTFYPADKRLAPVHSLRTVQWHAPNELPASRNLYTEYHYSYEIGYNAGPSEAQVTYTDYARAADGTLLLEEPSEGTEFYTQKRTYDLEGKTTYLDNEQIMFALRGVNSVVPFRTLNTSMSLVMDVSLRSSEDAQETLKYERTDESGTRQYQEMVSTARLELGYGTGIGTGAKLTYAKRTSETDNENRNVLIYMEQDSLHMLGKVCYALKRATFNNR